MKVYGNVDTKDVASFKLYAKTVTTASSNDFDLLHHDTACENPVSCDELKAMVFKAPIWVYYAGDDTMAAGLVNTIVFGVNGSDGKEYGQCEFNDQALYTKEYDPRVE